LLLALHVVFAVRALQSESIDIARYWQLASERGTPSVDYTVPYPIATFGLLRFEGLVAEDRDEFSHLVVAVSVASDVMLTVLILSEWGFGASVVYLVGVALLGKLAFDKVDLPVTLVATLAAILALRRRPVASGVTLAVATALKVWPLALAGLFAPSRARRRTATYAAAFGVTLAALGITALAVTGWDGLAQVVTFGHAKGWEIESVPADVARVFGRYGPAASEQGAERLRVDAPWVQPLLWCALLVLVVVATWLGRARNRIAPAWIAIVAGTLALSTLFSPQFVLWLLPPAAFAWSVGERGLAITVLGVAALTRLEFGGVLGVGGFGGLVHGDAWSVAELTARNLALVGVLVYALVRLAAPRSEPRPLGSPMADTGAASVRRGP